MVRTKRLAETALRLTGMASPSATRRRRDDSAGTFVYQEGTLDLRRGARLSAGTGQVKSTCAWLRKRCEG